MDEAMHPLTLLGWRGETFRIRMVVGGSCAGIRSGDQVDRAIVYGRAADDMDLANAGSTGLLNESGVHPRWTQSKERPGSSLRDTLYTATETVAGMSWHGSGEEL